MAPESEVPVVKQRWQFFTGRCHVVLQFCGAIIYGSPLVVDPAVVAAKTLYLLFKIRISIFVL